MKHFTAALKEKKLLYNFFKRFFLWKKIQYDDKILFQKQVHSEYCTCKDWSRMRLDGTRRNLSTYLFVAGLIQIFLLLRLKIQENQILLRNGRLCIKKVFLRFLILGPAKIFLKNTFLYLYAYKEFVYERSRNSFLSSITENVLTDRKQFLTFFTIFYLSEMQKNGKE